MVANPYGGPPSRVSLQDGVDGFVFWTRNAEPFFPALTLVKERGLPFFLHYSLTGYPDRLETATPAVSQAIKVIRQLVAKYGPRAVVWRYDPILLSSITSADWHFRNFQSLAAQLAGLVDEVVVSFLDPYRKTTRNLASGPDGPVTWLDPEPQEKSRILQGLTDLARERQIELTLCTEPALAEITGLRAARCIDADRLSQLAGRILPARQKGNRPGCLCAESRDIGAYDSCPQGCLYCYAVRTRENAKAFLQAHDPDSPFLQAFHPVPPSLHSGKDSKKAANPS